ncbi:PucR family transcriptional regulator [Gordonia sp. NPDC003376]
MADRGDVPLAAEPGSCPAVTVATLAAQTETVIVTERADTGHIIRRVVDLDDRDDEMPVPGEGDLVLMTWRPDRVDGPMPDLVALLGPVLHHHAPGAVMVCPARPLNPPAAFVSEAERCGIAVLWDRDSRPGLTERVRRLVERPRDPEPGSEPAAADIPQRLLRAAASPAELVLVLSEMVKAPVDFIADDTGARTAGRAGTGVGSRGTDITVRLGPRSSLVIRRARPLGESEHEMIELARPLLALHTRLPTMGDERAMEAARALKDILGDDLALREQAVRRSRRLTLFSGLPAVAIAVEVFSVSVNMAGLQRLRAQIHSVCLRFDGASVTIVKEGLCVVLLRADVDLTAVARDICRAVPVPIAIGSGDPASDVRGYTGSFRQARRAAAVGSRTGAINRLTRHADLGVLAILYQLPEHVRRVFVAETLGSIADNTDDALEQRRVLRLLLATDCNISESARRLYIHPNTLRGKITRIETIVGPIMSDPEHRLTVFTALRMFALDNKTDDLVG